jgi:hypothetical protein
MLFGRFGTGSTSACDLEMLTPAHQAFTTRALATSGKHRGVVEWGVEEMMVFEDRAPNLLQEQEPDAWSS